MSDANECAKANAKAWLEEIQGLVRPLDGSLGEDEQEIAQARIQEAPLSVQVRGGWYTPGRPVKTNPEEFEILLSTGGPALRIVGDLDDGEARNPQLQWQDWGTPWTPVPLEDAERAALSAFVSQFYFSHC